MKRAIVTMLVLCGFGAAGAWWMGYRVSTEGGGLSVHKAEEAAATGGRRGRRGGGGDNPVPVLAAMSEERDVPIYLDGLGTVQAYNQVSVRAMVNGPLAEVKFTEGQDVKKGDVLAVIDPRPYQASLDAALAKKQQDEAQLANARVDANRYAKLAATAFSSAQQADTARAQVAQLEAQVRGDQAQIDTARTQLNYATIKAPFDGRLGVRQVDVGNIVNANDTTPITVLTQLQPISVVFTLPQQSLAAVSAAMADGMPEVLALQAGRVLETGKLAVLDNQVDPGTGTIKLKATFPNATLALWPGGFVNVRMLVETRRGVVTVPTAAVQRGPQGTYVFVVGAEDKVRRAEVTVGYQDERLAIITAGLQGGAQVVTDGAQRLNDGSKVAVAGPDGTAPEAVPAERRAPGTARRGGRSAS